MKQKRLALLLGIIILAVLVYWFTQNHKASAPENGNAPAEGTENTIPSSSNSNSNTSSSQVKDSVVMSEQTSGSSVTIDNFYLSKPGFIAIQDSSGTVIGHSGLLQAGMGQDLEISAPVKTGRSYSAVIYVDDGNAKFNATEDQALTVNGSTLSSQFNVK